jgi:hypothetical protein
MKSIGEQQEDRILSALYGLIGARVQVRLPTSKRGIRALAAIRDRVPGTVAVALDRVVDEVLAQVEGEIEDAAPFAPEEEPS